MPIFTTPPCLCQSSKFVFKIYIIHARFIKKSLYICSTKVYFVSTHLWNFLTYCSIPYTIGYIPYYRYMPSTIKESLLHAGFSPIAADIYLILIEHGEMTVPLMLKHTELSRASVYEALSDLLSGNFLEYRKEGRNAFYKPVHPTKLFDLIESRKRELSMLENEMEATVKQLTGTFNLAFSRPGVRFFEGEQEVKKALYDTLKTSTGELLAYNAEDAQYFDDLSVNFIKERVRRGVRKKLIAEDSPTAREEEAKISQIPGHDDLTDVRFVDTKDIPFKSTVTIYDDVVLFATINKHERLGFLIKNQEIADFHKSLFYFAWDKLK